MKSKPRNTAARSPLMRKGGVHDKSKSGQRSREKVKLKFELQRQDKANGAFAPFFLAGKAMKPAAAHF